MPKISDYFVPYPKQKEVLPYLGKGNIIFYGGARGGGKMQTLDSIVLTPYGERRMGDLKVGDIISNPNGSPQKIIQIHPHGEQEIYRLIFEDGASTEVGLEHLWLTRITSSRKTKITDNDYLNDEDFGDGNIMDTKAIIEWIDKKNQSDDDKVIKKQHLCIPLCNPIKFTKSYKYDMRKIHPYILGVLIGDGSITEGSVSTNTVGYTGIDQEIDEKIINLGYNVRANGKAKTIYYEGIKDELIRIGIHGTSSLTKFIPEPYKYSTIEQRIELMQGLMDTDGYVDDRGHMSYTTISKQLAIDVQWVVRSLGGKATIKKDIAGYKDSDGTFIRCNDAYTVYFNTKINPDLVHLPRKKARCKYEFNNGVSELQRRIVGYEYVGRKEAQCITVSHPNGLYITDDFIVTHNSALALFIAVLVAIRYPNIRIVCIRKTYPELEQVFIDKLKLKYPEVAFKYKYLTQSKTARFSNGSRIVFKACETRADAEKIQGDEYQLMIIDEALNFAQQLIERMSGSVRNAGIKNWKATVLMTGNPGGISDAYFKSRFVRPDYSKWTEEQLKHKDRYIFIEAKLKDNPSLDNDDQYRSMLESITDENLRAAWLDGNWDVLEGQFFSEFNSQTHVIKPFRIPNHWQQFCGLDLGYTDSHPTVLLKFAKDPDNNILYVTDEYYGKGVAGNHARAIKQMLGEEPPIIYCDPAMYENTRKNEHGQPSPAMLFVQEGLPMVPSNNSRVNGWRIVKQWLHYSPIQSSRMFFFDTCPALINYLPTLRYNTRALTNTEDLDTTQDFDDFADALRYGIVGSNSMPDITTDPLPEYIQSTQIDYEEPEIVETFEHMFLPRGGYAWDETPMKDYNNNARALY